MNRAELRARVAFKRLICTPREEERWFKDKESYPDTHESIRNDRLVFLKAFRSAVVPVLESNLQRAIGNVLEVGCGTGFFSRHLAPDWLREKIICCDINFDSLRTMGQSGYGGEMVQGSIYVLPFTDSSMDAVIGYSSFDSFLYLNRAMGEVRRVLKPGGKIILFQDLVTRVYDFSDGNSQNDPLDHASDLETVELYHSVLIDEVERAGMTILAGRQDYLKATEPEPMKEVRQRVPDFEIDERPFPVFAYWDRGFCRPPVCTQARVSSGIEKAYVDESVDRIGGMFVKNPNLFGNIKAGAGDFVGILKMRYLVARKPRE